MSNSLGLIENIVVVMLENRSFDNFLGNLYPYSAQFEGLKLDGSMYNTYNNKQYPVTNSSSCSNPLITPDPDPGESFADINLQIFNQTNPPDGAKGNMAGFVNDWMATPEQYSEIPTNKECLIAPSWPALPRKKGPFGPELPSSPADIMFYFTPSQIPVSSALATSFGVSDSWFGSCPTQTYPNRYFVNCATSGGYVEDVDYLCHLEWHPDLPSIFQMLDGKGSYNHKNWKVYYHEFAIASLIKYVHDAPEGMVCNFDRSDNGSDSKGPTFLEDVEGNTLPTYSFIEPRYREHNNQPENDNHPPTDVSWGEILVGTIYNKLRGSSYWPKMLLIITYDEHGGCFDHVIPPTATAPKGTVLRDPSSFGFDRFGPRVPAILVSPYIPAGSVVRPADFSYIQGSGTSTTNGTTPYDHTSIIATLVERFNLTLNGQSYLTQRDRQAPTLAEWLSLDANHANNGPAVVTSPDPPSGDDGSNAGVPDSHLADIFNAIQKNSGSNS